MTAYNAAGESPLAQPIFVNPICSIDSDCAVMQQCQTGSCNAQLGCVTQNVSDGTSCDDGDANTSGDHCQAGVCINDSPPGVGGTVDITQIVPGSASGMVGTTSSFLATATSTGTPLFRWLVMPLTTGNWMELRDYSPNPMLTWTPIAAGNYRVAVSARTEGAAQEQDWMALDFTVAAQPAPAPAPSPAPAPAPAPMPMAEISVDDPDPSDMVPMRVPIALEAAGGAGLEYRFLLFYRGKPWRVMRNFSSNPRFVWLPMFRPGAYEVGVEVRNRGETKPWGVDSTTVQIVNAPLLECSTSGGVVSCSTPSAGGELDYQWWIRGPRTGWQVLHNYGQMGDSVSFTPNNGSGTYYVGVYAKPVAGSTLGARPVYTYSLAFKY
jgi:hypothetical protein